MVKRYEVYEGELSEWSGGVPPGNRSVVVMAADYEAIEAELEKSITNARANWIDAEQLAQRVSELETELAEYRKMNLPTTDEYGT